MRMMDVIVIGCGASGVAALRKLHDTGFRGRVLGLEAADRIGGRICTVEFGENAVDIGGAWCHGEKDNAVFELANPLNLLGRTEPSTSWYFQSNGEPIPKETSEKILKAVADEVADADKNTCESILECIRKAAKSNPVLKDQKLTNAFLENYERQNHLGGQDDIRKSKSLRGLQEFYSSEGEQMLNWKGKGYKMLLDVLLNKYPDPSKEIPVTILLNKEVENIKWTSSQPSNALVQVKCKDGSLYAARSVIVTLSVGALKERHSKLFSPPLPAQKVTAIQTLQMANLGKIYVEFSAPWWPKTPASFVFMWRDEDKAQFPEDQKWVTEIFSLDTVAYQPNVLLAWMYGNGVEQMEKANLEEVKNGVKKLLDLVIKKNFEVTPVKNIIRSQWATNPLTRGAYAYRSVATEEANSSAEALASPLSHSDGFPVVCFAGEATSYHRHSAVHGAVEAGFREADRLVESFRLI